MNKRPPSFLDNLSAAEKVVVENTKLGKPADFRSYVPDEDNPMKSGGWGENRSLRARFVEWLCTTEDLKDSISEYGIRIAGAKIIGRLNMRHRAILHQLVFLECSLGDGIELTSGRVPAIRIRKSFLLDFKADGLRADNDISLDHSHIAKAIYLRSARIGGSLDCRDLYIGGEDDKAFIADRLSIGEIMNCENMVANGQVRLVNAAVDGQLKCDGATFESSNNFALTADGLDLNGNLYLTYLKTQGGVSFHSSHIRGHFLCNGSIFKSNKMGVAFSADSINVEGCLLLDKVTTSGSVRLNGASIGEVLSCRGCTIDNGDKEAFSAVRINIRHNLNFIFTDVVGGLYINGAEIGSQLIFDKSTFKNPGQTSLSIHNAKVESELLFREVAIEGVADFSYANVGLLVDEESSWPTVNGIKLDGFEYKAISAASPVSAEQRIRWLRLQKKSEFMLQPYEQLAKIFQQMGHETDSRRILFEKQADLCKYGKISNKARLWNRFLGLTIGHGYQPWRALLVLLVLFFLGAYVFRAAAHSNIMQPSKERVYMDKDYIITGLLPPQYPQFEANIYSLDVLVPFLDLHQENYWLPSVRKNGGKFVRCYLWFQIIAGWVFSTLSVASLTGLIRKDK